MKAEATPDWSFSDWDGKPSAATQEAAFKRMHGNIGGHNDPGKSSASNNDGGGGGISWFKRTVNTVKGWFGSGSKSSVTAEEGTWTFDPILAGDIFSGGQVTKQAEALDVYKKDGINAYLYQTIANAHREELFNFITGGYGVSSAAPSTIAKAEEEFVEGTFSVLDRHGYPAGGPKPNGPFRLLEGVEYSAARQAANSANRTLRASNPSAFESLQIHEIQSVIFNGNPTDISNKLFLTPQQHIQYTNFWNALMRNATKK
ncbi:hypothetical protein [Flavobacterium sp. Sd200]|uniref:hypothetical protein n=1 Tax=Flavobacterium sp. Sd200 TaxID=2692211 RepID=UPI001F3463EA|nr:hypothetical protein [Flavobacterium sp. Sd200]